MLYLYVHASYKLSEIEYYSEKMNNWPCFWAQWFHASFSSLWTPAAGKPLWSSLSWGIGEKTFLIVELFVYSTYYGYL